MYIDNIEFAVSHKSLELELEIAELSRTKDLLDELSGKLKVKINGDVLDKPILRVSIYGRISTLCQICLDPVTLQIRHEGIVPIFKNEALLDEALFGETADSPDGILADSQFDVLEFIEDEIIMLLPPAPKHRTCNFEPAQIERNNPFGLLKKQLN